MSLHSPARTVVTITGLLKVDMGPASGCSENSSVCLRHLLIRLTTWPHRTALSGGARSSGRGSSCSRIATRTGSRPTIALEFGAVSSAVCGPLGARTSRVLRSTFIGDMERRIDRGRKKPQHNGFHSSYVCCATFKLSRFFGHRGRTEGFPFVGQEYITI